jgi:hypothetical protein
MVDLSPGFNVSHWGPIPYPAATGTKTVLGFGSQPNAMQKQAAADQAAIQQLAAQGAHPNDVQTNSTSSTGGYYPGVVQGASTNISAAQQAANQQAIDLANSAMGRLPGQLQTALGNVQHQYDQNYNQLQSGYNQAHQGYDQSTGQNTQQFVTNKNKINDQGSQGLLGLLRTLGQHGAGGSSAALFAAPDAVNQFVTQQRSGAGQTYGENQQALDTNWGNYQSGFANSKKQLADWLSQNQDQARTNSEQNRISLLSQLAGLQASPTAAQPYIDKINAANDQIDQLAKFNPTYSGKTPVYNAPDVASYTVDQAGAPVLGNPGNGTGGGSILNFLLGLKDKNQQQIA